jgi:hypothetical protein
MIIRSVYRVIAAAPTVGDVAYRPIQIRDCAACGAVDSAEDPPPNDDFANAIPIAGTSGTIVGDNSNATREDGELSSWGGKHLVLVDARACRYGDDRHLRITIRHRASCLYGSADRLSGPSGRQ